MTKKRTLFIALAALSIIACKKTDDSNTLTRTGTFEQRISKDWDLAEVDYEGYMPNPFNASQQVYFSGEGEDVYGTFQFQSDYTAEYEMGFTAKIDIGTSEPARLPFYRPGSGYWWTNAAKDSIWLVDDRDSSVYRVIEDYDKKQRWQTVLPILDSISGTFVDVNLQVILRR